MTKLTGSALIVLVLAAPALAAGETKNARDWASLAGCSPTSQIRMTPARGARVRGAFVSASADSMVIRTAKGERALARREVKRVEVKVPGRRAEHTLIGMAVGAGVAGLAAAARHADRWETPIDETMRFASVLAALGALTGAVLPAGGWKEIYCVGP
jgi:hypothetical protein